MPKLRGVPSRQDTLAVSAAIRGKGATSAEGILVKSTGETVDTKFLRTDGDGTCSWQTPAGGGNVSTSGSPALNEFAKFVSATAIEGRNYTETKSDLSLGNVENTAISNWAGTSNVTTLGTISTGVWEGSVIDSAYLDVPATAIPWVSGSGLGYWSPFSDDIGIGTATPAAKLHVSGTLMVSSSVSEKPQLDIKNTNDDNTGGELRFTKDGTTPAGNDYLGNIKFYGDDTDGTQIQYAKYDVRANDVTAASPNAQHEWHGIDGSGNLVHQMSLLNSSLKINNSSGDLSGIISPYKTTGISLKSIGNKLAINPSNSAAAGELHLLAANIGNHAQPAGSVNLHLIGTAEQLRLGYDADYYAGFTVAADGALTIATVDDVAAEADIILSPDGNVGIDTTNPSYALEVAGDFSLGSSVTLIENATPGTISGTAFQYTVAEAIYIYDIHGGFTAAVIGYGNYYFVKPEAAYGPLPSAIPVALPDGSSEVGLKITIAQPVDADPAEALAVAAQGGDVIYEGTSNSASATVAIPSFRGANKTFVTIAAGVWIVTAMNEEAP